jgi:hypothetical protein
VSDTDDSHLEGSDLEGSELEDSDLEGSIGSESMSVM